MDLHHTGVVIRQNRRWQNMSQEELAKRADVTIGLVQRIEFGRMTDVHLKKLERILHVLNIPYNSFSLEMPLPYVYGDVTEESQKGAMPERPRTAGGDYD